ncbi:MAG: hypothetical protein NC123_20920 [Butyrivibrio sp.]|nr:hypothetical protein [Butyrivibrio sp.]
MRKKITRLVAMVLLCSMVLAMGQSVEAKEMEDMGYLEASGSMEVRWSDEESTEYAYLPFKVKKDGYITFTANNVPEKAGTILRGEWFLCNSARKEITSSDSCGFYNEESMTFAVKGESSYYLKVKLWGRQEMVIDYQYREVNDKSGNKKSKAYKLKKNKKAEGLLIAGQSKADWYKITLTKKQVLKLTVATKSYRGIGVKVYDKKGNEITGLDYWQVTSTDSVNDPVTLASRTGRYSDSGYKKLAKGTYYVKVYINKEAKGCGYYSLKWK